MYKSKKINNLQVEYNQYKDILYSNCQKLKTKRGSWKQKKHCDSSCTGIYNKIIRGFLSRKLTVQKTGVIHLKFEKKKIVNQKSYTVPHKTVIQKWRKIKIVWEKQNV